MNKVRFTLVELLLVIAIIAILASLLLPVLSRAKRAANRAACVANMKQQNIALRHYFSDNKGQFPQASVGRAVYWMGNKGNESEYDKAPQDRPLNIYIAGPNLNDDSLIPGMECPQDDISLFKQRGSSYTSVSDYLPTGNNRTKYAIKNKQNFLVTYEIPVNILMHERSWWDEKMYYHYEDKRLRFAGSFLDGRVEFNNFSFGLRSSPNYTVFYDEIP